MIKEIIAYILVLFGVAVAIVGTVFYLRMYKAMIGQHLSQKNVDNEKTTKVE